MCLRFRPMREQYLHEKIIQRPPPFDIFHVKVLRLKFRNIELTLLEEKSKITNLDFIFSY